MDNFPAEHCNREITEEDIDMHPATIDILAIGHAE